MDEPTFSAPGRPFAGIELGGTKCVCTLAFGPDMILDQHVIPTGAPEETLGAIRIILERWHRSGGFGAIGIAAFGPVCLDPSDPQYGSVLATTKPGWSGTDILRLARGFDVPVGFDTDVNAAALAEVRWGSGRGLRDFAYVTVGTGVGVGLIVHGQPTRGIGHSEIGHIRVPRVPGDDFISVCSYHGDCVEGLASGSALAARLGDRVPDDTGADDPVWVPVVAAIAAMCHDLVVTTGPWRIAIGGGVFERQPHLHGRVERALVDSLAGYMTLPAGRPYITPPDLGGLAGPMGSIALAQAAVDRGDPVPDTSPPLALSAKG